MHDYLFAPPVVRVLMVLGVVVAMIFYEKVQLTTGGAIVPAYLAVAIPRPLLVVSTLFAGWLSWVAVHKILPRKKILYGRRKFEVEVLVGLALIFVFTLVSIRLRRIDPVLAGLTGIGFLIPGIICHDMGRQGPKKTLLAIGGTTAILSVFAVALAGLLPLLDPFPAEKPLVLTAAVGYPRELVIVAVAISVLVGMAVFAKFGLRSGGFITGAYMALVAPRWPDLLFAIVCSMVTYAVVVHGLLPRLLLFGRRKLAAMILISALVTWPAELVAVALSHGLYTPWKGLTVVTIMAPALLANDAQRQGWRRTLLGVSLTSASVYVAMLGVAALARWGGWL